MAKRSLLWSIVGLGCVLSVTRVWGAELLPAIYFPLAEGNRWVYESSEGTPDAPAVESWQVVRQAANAFVVEIHQPSFNSATGVEEVFVATPAGVGRRAVEPAAAQPQFFLKAPFVVGTKWETPDGQYEISAVDKTVTVPAGTFTNCLEVTHTSLGDAITVISHYAPGVGMVFRDETFPFIEGSGNFNLSRREQVVLQLKEWTVKE